MIKPSTFLSKYKIILFDMDGVMTSEQRYWDCTALTVFEYMNPGINPDSAMADVSGIRNRIFNGIKTLIYLKDSGVNSNWDTTYIILSAALILNTEDFAAVHDYIVDLDMNALEMYDYFGEKSPLGRRGGELYKECVYTFQEWYLGDKLFEEKWHRKAKKTDKSGLVWLEEPVIPKQKLISVLKTLHDFGYSLGIGTGRVDFEIEFPMESWDIRKYFDENRLITYTEVINAEKKASGETLTKPNPYMFLKGMLGKDFDDIRILKGDYDREIAGRTLVVGDAGADILAAQGGGMDFAAVLTGVSGGKARDYFKESGATYILNDMSGLVEGIEQLNNG